MAKQPHDTFLPSGAVEETYFPSVFGSRSASVSPSALPPRSFQPYNPSQVQGGRNSSPKPYSRPSAMSRSSSQPQAREENSQLPLASTQHQNGHPISPPFSRTTSGEDSRAAQIQSWRLYTKHLRENAQGERAHMEADRARMEEVMAEERELWDQERTLMKGRIEELESQLAIHGNLQQGPIESGVSSIHVNAPQNGRPHPSQSSMTTSSSANTNGSPARRFPQESGRNADGSPFYAPAPRNPSRTFGTSQNNELRVDSISISRETPLRITSKELTESDFGLRSPPAETRSQEGSVMGESIDISLLQPELDGVPIKASAVSPSFVAKVLSPNSSLSPSKPSSNINSPLRLRDTTRNQDGLNRSGSQSKKSTLEVIAAPETHRLIMNAGHTPNHSIHKFDLGESGSATPTQSQHQAHYPSMGPDEHQPAGDENLDPDPELRGPLGLKNDPPKDELFLVELTNKLREVKESGLLSSENASVDSDVKALLHAAASSVSHRTGERVTATEAVDDDSSGATVDEAPVLRVKASMNFGRPFGSL